MQDIRWKAFYLALVLALLCLIVWAAQDAITALTVLAIGLVIYIIGHVYWLHKLYIWLNKPVLNQIPNGSGIYEDIFALLYHEQRKNSRNRTQLSTALERFRHAASALPDGVVVLNSNNEIQWCNPPAALQLGLDLSQDSNQPINYLVRHGEFVAYLQAQEYSNPIKLNSWRNAEITLEIQLIPFGTKQKLLICRDISALEKTEIMRRDFIANVSHELRTPLTVVGGFLETLGDMQGAVPESTKSYFDIMLDQTSRMRRIIEDLLTLSTIESNVKGPDNNAIDMNALIDKIYLQALALSETLPAPMHKIHLNIDKTLAIKGALDEILSAFSNLVSNAVRYTPSGGDIFISWQLHDSHATFSVRDSGIGIDAQHIDRLTERFYRVDSSRSRDTGGTGLGLAIVKHILNRHQAKLEITSELGTGSTFIIMFSENRIVKSEQ